MNISEESKMSFSESWREVVRINFPEIIVNKPCWCLNLGGLYYPSFLPLSFGD